MCCTETHWYWELVSAAGVGKIYKAAGSSGSILENLAEHNIAKYVASVWRANAYFPKRGSQNVKMFAD